MNFWVTSNGDPKVIGKFATYQFDQLVGVLQTAFGDLKFFSALWWITTQRDDVFDACCFCFTQIVRQLFDRRSNTSQMCRNGQAGDFVYFRQYLQGGSLGGSTGAIGAGEIIGAKFHQSLDVLAQGFHTGFGFWREQLERYGAVRTGVVFCETHWGDNPVLL